MRFLLGVKAVSAEWKTLREIEEKFGSEGANAIRFFEKMKLVETKWQTGPSSSPEHSQSKEEAQVNLKSAHIIDTGPFPAQRFGWKPSVSLTRKWISRREIFGGRRGRVESHTDQVEGPREAVPTTRFPGAPNHSIRGLSFDHGPALGPPAGP